MDIKGVEKIKIKKFEIFYYDSQSCLMEVIRQYIKMFKLKNLLKLYDSYTHL